MKIYSFPAPSAYDAAGDRENNFIGRRIAQARSAAGFSLAALKDRLEKLGVSVSIAAINKWEKGGSAPNAYQLIALTHALNIENGLDYFSGSSPMPLNEAGMKKLADYRIDLIASGRYAPAPPASIEYIDMPVSSLAVSAGTGAFLDSDNFESLSFPRTSVPEGAQFGLRVSGDSMEPVYHDGQIVWVRRCEKLLPGQVGIFVYDGEGYLKVYGEQEPDESHKEEFTDSYGRLCMQPVLLSYNRAYPPRPVSAFRGFRVVGRVL